MHNGTEPISRRDGAALMIVLSLMLLGVVVVSTIAMTSGTRIQQARRQTHMEQAFYLAEAGAERASSLVAAGQGTGTTVGGTLGNGSYEANLEFTSLAGGDIRVDVYSTGTVHGVSRGVTLRGLQRVSWARYALWYDSESTKLWIVGGEKFNGPVYSNPQFHFHSSGVSTKGQVHFMDRAWTSAATIEKENATVNPRFDMGLRTSVAMESMSTIDFDDLRSDASLVLDGTTTITLSGTQMRVTNSRRSWSNRLMDIPADGMIYVRTVTSGTTSTRTGNLTVSATGGLTGRVTLVADNDILIADHIRYTTNPQTTPSSTDALGLIAKRHVSVQTSASNNLDVYAHIICQNGGFGVASYNSGSNRGTLTVYGGIVNKIRNPVGTTSGTGYLKNYVFDTRFGKNPPPFYPVMSEEFEWLEWNG